MKVKVSQTKELEIEVSQDDIDKIVVMELCRVYEMDFLATMYSYRYLDQGNLYDEWEQGAGSHSYQQTEIVREATERDILFFMVMSRLAQAGNNYARRYYIKPLNDGALSISVKSNEDKI